MNGVAGPRGPMGKFGQPVVPNLAVRHLCPNCMTDPPNIVEEYSHGDLVCADCGTILGDRIVDTRSEWRTFAGDEGGDDPSRVGGPSNPLLGNASLETSISARDGRTGMSRDLMRAQTRANQQAHGPGGGSSDAQLLQAFQRIQEKADSMQLVKSVTEAAQHAYKVADQARLTKGKNDDPMIAACFIWATRASGAGRSFREVSHHIKVPKSDLGRAFTLLKAAIRDSGLDASAGAHTKANDSVDSLLGRFVNLLSLRKNVENAAKYIASVAVQKAPIDGRSPLSIAAGVLYFTTTLHEMEDTTSKNVADIAGVSDSTIKLISKKVAEVLDVVIKPEWKTQFPKGYAKLDDLGKNSAAASAAKPSRAGTPSGTPAPSGAATPAKLDKAVKSEGTETKTETEAGDKTSSNGSAKTNGAANGTNSSANGSNGSAKTESK